MAVGATEQAAKVSKSRDEAEPIDLEPAEGPASVLEPKGPPKSMGGLSIAQMAAAAGMSASTDL